MENSSALKRIKHGTRWMSLKILCTGKGARCKRLLIVWVCLCEISRKAREENCGRLRQVGLTANRHEGPSASNESVSKLSGGEVCTLVWIYRLLKMGKFYGDTHHTPRRLLKMSTAALFLIAPDRKQLKCSSAVEWINKLWYVYSMDPVEQY